VLLFAAWVVSPFVVMGTALAASARFSVLADARVLGAMIVGTLTSVVAYGVAALGPFRPPTAVFVLVAPASWLLLVAVVTGTILASRRSSSRRKLSGPSSGDQPATQSSTPS
jgi:hypothetical protein